jgi:long-chain-fatty-acid--[acyl-carrier-protein] ligase
MLISEILREAYSPRKRSGIKGLYFSRKYGIISFMLSKLLKKACAEFFYLLIRGLVSIRYRLSIRGIENLNPKTLSKKGGVLFLPNHPAEIDPVILTLVLWGRYRAHPLVVEQFYHLKGAHYLQTLVGAIPIPDLGGVVNKWKQKQIEKCFQHIADGLRKGSNYLIYPSGRLKQSGEEAIGGASFVHNLVQECPEANIVLIRTTGLWGSRFSRALTGSTPDFGKVAWEGVKIVLKNLIFFTPRRVVTIEIEPAPVDFPFKALRLEFNKALEKWYNIRGPEPLKLVSDHFWNESYPTVLNGEEKKQSQQFSISPEMEKEITDKISDLAKKTSVKRNDHLARDLGLDSLDIADLQTFIIERYETPSLDIDEIQTVEDILRAASKPSFNAKTVGRKLVEWPKEPSRPSVQPPQGSTIPEAFLRVCDRMEYHAACADERMGVISYRRLKLIALTLSYHFKSFKGDRIGVLLPSSTISYVIILALQLAGKIPVMLNWTVGVRALNHCKELGQFKTVLSSRRFLEHLADGDLGDLDDLLLLIEDVRPAISLWSRLKGFYGLFKDTNRLLKDLKLQHIQPDDTAVILFTSGTESLPKGVPLSHHNVLSNQKAGASCIQVSASDVMYGVLPPFHSFGFSVTGLFPLLFGLKVFYAPDPTQYYGMAHDIEEWSVTLLCSAPTFMKGLFQAARPSQLRSLRLAVAGAEKVPEALFEYMEKKGSHLLEGYGITECSPIVTLTMPGKPREGVGQPVPGVELCIIHPETGKELPPGFDGEVCIHGPNVFKGYLGSASSPFIELQGKKWYRSGDRGRLSPNGSLILSGRLKRFIKIGGEMVSLAGVEEELIRITRQKGWTVSTKEGPPLAVVVAETHNDKPLIVVFSTFEVSKDSLNDALRESGFGRIVKIAAVKKIDQIPINGAGKVRYRALEEAI